ncbi:podocan-like [Babylonia areolata]|uniref:podocan-like n=1 Tax=Babylonia areolata TaxID=304850 RepID=UPI003FD068BD
MKVAMTMKGLALLGVVALCCVVTATACPDKCRCDPEGRGQRVRCSGGHLSSLLVGLPHNTARLLMDSVTSKQTLGHADLERAPRSLIHLTITNSALQVVEDSAFSPSLTSLQVLDLSKNSIRSIAGGAFTGLSSLRFLNLSGNQLSDVGSALEPLVSLRQLDLGHNFLSELRPAAVQSLSSLSTLCLDGNHFRSLTGGTFQHLAFLSELRIRGCGVSSISEDFFASITRVKLLDLGSNRLKVFPSSTKFSELRQLKHLYLDDNELLKLHPHQFSELSLLTLSLAHNRISSVPADALSGLTVENLDLSENKLLELRGECLQPVAQHLAVLNVANNPIRVLQPNAFEGLRLLDTLNISACSLTVLPAETFSGLYSLRRLDASWNHVQNVSEDLVKVFDRLVTINLYHNAWHCDCHIAPFRNWLRSRRSAHKLHCLPGQDQDDDCSALRCASPDKLAGKLISSLLDSDLERCSGGGGKGGLPVPVQISIVLACLLFSLGMLLLTLYLWRRGRTRKELKQMFQKKKRRPDSRIEEVAEEDQDKIAPFVDCDNESLKESHRSFVFRHYFDQMVTDPKLLEPTSPSQVAPSEARVGFAAQKDSVYSSDPALYEASHNSHSIVVGIESTV